MSLTADELAIKAVIDAEPANAAGANPVLSDQQVLDWLNEMVSVLGYATRNTLLKWCAEINALKRLEDFKADADPVKQSLAYVALELIAGDGLDLSDEDAQTHLASMVSKGMFTDIEIDSLKAKATVQMKRWQAENLSRPLFGHVQRVRAS